MFLKKLVTKLLDWALFTVGSTRSSALIRMGLALNIWGRWGGEVLLFRDLSAQGILLSVNFFLASTLMLVGLFSQFTTLWTGLVLLTMHYYFGVDQGREAWTHHHTYLLTVATFLCAFIPAGKSYSVDRWLAIRRALRRGEPIPLETANLWGLRLLAIQMSAVYFFTAYDKTYEGFLSGARLEEIFMFYYFGSDYPEIPYFHTFMVLMAYGTLALEYSLTFGLHFPQIRKWIIIPGILLHAFFYVLLPVRTFTTTVFVIYLAYFNADAIHAFLDALQGYSPPQRIPIESHPIESQASALD